MVIWVYLLKIIVSDYKLRFYFKGGFMGIRGRGKGRYLFKINPRVGWDHSVRHIGWIDRYWLSNPKATGTSTGRLGLIQFHTGICILHIKQILGSILTFKEISLVGKWKILRGLNLQWQRKCFAPLLFEGLILRYFLQCILIQFYQNCTDNHWKGQKH